MATNYKDEHLIAILAGLAEKIIGRSLITFLQAGKYNPQQYAFTPGFSAHDLVTAFLITWILGICTDSKIDCYLGAITGASHSRIIYWPSYAQLV